MLKRVMRLVKEELSRAEQVELFEFLRDDQGLRAYRSLRADVDRARLHRRERAINRKADWAEHARNGREAKQELVKLRYGNNGHSNGRGAKQQRVKLQSGRIDETARERKIRLSRPTGPLRSHSMAEFIALGEDLEA